MSSSSSTEPSPTDAKSASSGRIHKSRSQSLPFANWVRTSSSLSSSAIQQAESPSSQTVSEPISLLSFIRQEWTIALLLMVALFTALVVMKHKDVHDAAYFTVACVTLVPVSKILRDSIEQLTLSIGLKSSMNTYGSRPDRYAILSDLVLIFFGTYTSTTLVFTITALFMSEFRLAQTFVIGSVINKITLLPGISVFVGGLKLLKGVNSERERIFSIEGAQIGESLMLLSCATLVIPTGYFMTYRDGSEDSFLSSSKNYEGLLFISRGTAILSIILYMIFCNFQLRTHYGYFHTNDNHANTRETGKSLSTTTSAFLVLICTTIAGYASYCVLSSLYVSCRSLGISPFFVGVFLLPFLLGLPLIQCALSQDIAHTVGLCVGSAIQIVLYVLPVLVILGWITGREFALYFDLFETIVFFVSVILTGTLVMDGKLNYLEGMMLTTLYIVICLAAFNS